MKILKFLFFAFFTLLLSSNVQANNDLQKKIADYIQTYKNIAISEMHRTGIPASIKLAQGLLESNFGRSELALVGNNHFGIKCGSTWDGGTFYKKDDDTDAHGRLIESCFRAFANGDQSYIEHSYFLQDARKKNRYGFLFNFDSNDYKSWAKGLRDAGYATDPRYPQKLISIIEKYKLAQFDVSKVNAPIAKNQVLAQSDDQLETQPPKAERISVKRARYPIKMVNEVSYVVANQGDTPKKIANMIGISSHKIMDFNEGLKNAKQSLQDGERVFIQSKKRNFKLEKYHIVKDNQTMYDIAQIYGLSLKHLRSRNKLNANEEPYAGEKIQLKGLKFGKKPEVKVQSEKIEFLF